VTATADVAAGAQTITLTGAIIGAPTPVGCNGVWVSTTTDLRSTTIVAPPALGGVVSNVGSTIAAAERFPLLTGKSVTVTFTTQSLLLSGQFVTITLPAGYISGTILSTGVNFGAAAATSGTAPQYIVTATADVAAGAQTITLTGATIGAPVAGSATGVQVSSSTDRVNNGASLALGGTVTGVSMTVLSADRIVNVANRKIVVAFTTTTIIPNGGFITITLPPSFQTAVTPGTTASSGLAASQSRADNSIVLTATADITAGSKIVTICGVTLGLTATDRPFGVSVTTSRDYTTTCSATGIVGMAMGTISAVSMTIPFASRVVSTATAATITFTTSRSIPSPLCNAVNTFIIAVPAGFFASGTAVAAGLTGYTITSQNLVTGTFTLTGSTALNAGIVSVTISGLTLRSTATEGSDTGVTITAPLHNVMTGTSGPISGYQVTSVAVSGTCQTSSICRTVTIGIIAAGAATTIQPGGTLVISGLPFTGTPDAMSFGSGSGSTLVTSSAISSNSITLTVNSGGAAWALGATATITLTGITLSASGGPWTVSVGNSQPMWSQTYVSTSTGTTTTTSLTLARAVPSTQNTQATIAFSTTNGIADGDTIRVNYPVGFFIDAPRDFTCLAPLGTSRYLLGATGLGPCSSLTITGGSVVDGFLQVTYAGPGTAAGPQVMVLTGVTLSTTERATSNTLSVVVSSSSCSAGPVNTGSISNSNPGGPTAPSSSGMSWVPSVLAAFTCALVFML